MKSIVSEKGQITIPKRLRDSLGLVPGTVIDFDSTEGTLVGKKILPEDIFVKWRGKGQLPNASSVDDYLKLVRDDNSR